MSCAQICHNQGLVKSLHRSIDKVMLILFEFQWCKPLFVKLQHVKVILMNYLYYNLSIKKLYFSFTYLTLKCIIFIPKYLYLPPYWDSLVRCACKYFPLIFETKTGSPLMLNFFYNAIFLRANLFCFVFQHFISNKISFNFICNLTYAYTQAFLPTPEYCGDKFGLSM